MNRITIISFTHEISEVVTIPKISVIIPIYNVEQFLPRCIDSVLKQSFDDFELILVDDGSPDNCGAICDEYATRDSRIRVIHQENQGVSAARNLGIAEAKGKYAAFVDSDDTIHPQMYELLSFVLDQTDYPFVHCGFHRVKDEEMEPASERYNCSLDQVQELTSEQGMLKMMDWKTYGHYIWKGLYRTLFIKEFLFQSGIRWEDVIWSGQVVGNAKKYGYVPFDLYKYNIHGKSLVHTFDWKTQRQYFQAFQSYLDIARRLTPEVSFKVELAAFQAFIERVNSLILNDILSDTAWNEIKIAAKSYNLTVSKILCSDLNLRR